MEHAKCCVSTLNMFFSKQNETHKTWSSPFWIATSAKMTSLHPHSGEVSHCEVGYIFL